MVAGVAKEKPPSAAALKHAQKRTHRRPGGQFAESLEERIKRGDPTIGKQQLQPPDDQQDAGGGYNPDGDDIQQ